MTERNDTPIFDVHAEDQEAEGRRYAAEVEVASAGPRQMTVRDMTRTLADLPPDALVLICAHEWPGMENQGWFVQALDPSNDGQFVLIEGAGPVPQGVNDAGGE